MMQDIGQILWEEDIAREREWQAEQWRLWVERSRAIQQASAEKKRQWTGKLEGELRRLQALPRNQLTGALRKLARDYKRKYLTVRRAYRRLCRETTLQTRLRA